MKTKPEPSLFPLPDTSPDGRVFINSSLWFVDKDGFRVVFFRNEPIYRVALDDFGHVRLIAVALHQSGRATQREIARAFGHSVETQIRWERLYMKYGLAGLQNKRPSGRPSRLNFSQDQILRRWFQEGLSNVEMARRFCVDEATIRRALKRLGLVRQPQNRQHSLPGMEDPSLEKDDSKQAAPENLQGVASQEVPETSVPLICASSPSETENEVLCVSAIIETEVPMSEKEEIKQTIPENLQGTANQEVLELSIPTENTSSSISEEKKNETDVHKEAPDSGPYSSPEPCSSHVLPNSQETFFSFEGEKKDTENNFITFDSDPTNRCFDRLFARMKILVEAIPLFANREFLPKGGVWLAIPILVSNRIVDIFLGIYKNFNPFGNSFYGLRSIILTLIFCALLRIKRPEGLKECQPRDLGALLGLDRSPEVKTLRRKLKQLADCKMGHELMKALAESRLTAEKERGSFFYLDGHFREYSGKEPLFKSKKPQRQVACPGSTDTWVNDSKGEPLLVVTNEVNAGLTKEMEPILQEIKPMLAEGDRLIVVFDRGGFSKKLFERLMNADVDILTYRKGKTRQLPRSYFSHQAEKVDGVDREYNICDRPRVRVGKGKEKGKKRLTMREIRVLREDGRQTCILTTIKAEKLSAVQLCVRIFARWRQENFFKYMEEEYALDALLEYGADDVGEEVDRRNPKYERMTRQIRGARKVAAKILEELGGKIAENEKNMEEKKGCVEPISEKTTLDSKNECSSGGFPPNCKGEGQEDGSLEKADDLRMSNDFRDANAELFEKLEKAQAKVKRLLKRRRKIPRRIPAKGMKVLKRERKLIGDAIKMTAYQIETELLESLKDLYPRCDDEGRTFLQSVFQSPCQLEKRGEELHLTIDTQFPPHKIKALKGLCEKLNEKSAVFPGTNLRLVLGVKENNL